MHPGILIGILLIPLVILTAILLARQANRGVQRFREDHHETFRGPPPSAPR